MTAPVHRWRAFALLAVAFFVTIADLAIVNVALPTIGLKLHFSESNLQWVVTAYGLTFGGLLLLGGRATDLLGRRRIFMIGLNTNNPKLKDPRVRQGLHLAIDRDTLIKLRYQDGIGKTLPGIGWRPISGSAWR